MKRDRFINNGVCCDLYWPTGSPDSFPIAMYLYGFPGSTGKSDPVNVLVDNGYCVLQPHYLGTYDSAGKSTPSSCIRTVHDVFDTVRQRKAVSVKSGNHVALSGNILLLAGHSFGAFIALKSAPKISTLRILVLLGPAIGFSPDESGLGLREDGRKHIDYVKNSRPFTYRLGSKREWIDMYDGKLDGTSGAAPKSLRAVVGLVGELDNYFDHVLLRKNFASLVGNSLVGEYQTSLEFVPDVGHGPAGLMAAIQSKLDTEAPG